MTAYEQAQKDFTEELQRYLSEGYTVWFDALCAPKDGQLFRIDLIKDDMLVRIIAEKNEKINYVGNVGKYHYTYIIETRDYKYHKTESRSRKILDENMNARCIHFVKGIDVGY